ncbi:MAG: hypothetical protein EOO54_08855 [Haliea sp.]|nr:MAG: hypothetical protein EOO54_08855 [Haliea sp.]
MKAFGNPQDPRNATRWLLAFLAVMLLLLQLHGPRGGTDDDVLYMNALNDVTLAAWLKHRYAVWSGRVVIDAVTLAVIPHVWLWRLLSGLFCGLLVWAIATGLGRRRDGRVVAFLVLGFFLLDLQMMRESLLWMSGSFNYLWPAALGALACLPFVRPELSRRLFIATIPAAVYCTSQEQAGALLFSFQLILAAGLLKSGLFHRWHGLQIMAAAGSFAVMALSPGSVARYGVNVRHWFPEYGMLTFAERAFSGLHMAFGHVFGAGHAMGLVFSALLLLVALQQRRHGVARLIAGVPLAAALVPTLVAQLISPHTQAGQGVRWLLKFTPGQGGQFAAYWIGNVENATDIFLYFNFLLVFVAALCAAVTLYEVFGCEGRWERTLAVLVWLGALTSAAIVGLTPTLFASGQRIFFMQDVLVLGLACALFARLPAQTQRYALWAMAPLAAIGLAVLSISR